MTEGWLHPALLLIGAALLFPLLKGLLRKLWMLAVPAVVLGLVLQMQPGEYGQIAFMGLELLTARVDALSLVFLHVFAIILLIGAIYALHVEDWVQHAAGFAYAGSAMGAVLAGDLVTLYVFWELMVLSSVWLIWRRQGQIAYAAGMRYLLVHALGGVLLLAGVIAQMQLAGSIAFEALTPGTAAFWLILAAFMINAAVPPLHAWLPDAYPEATVTGAVLLSAFTTKTAVYTLMRGYTGTELLVGLGIFMVLYGVTYAILANDIRRILAYHIVSQVGYMVCAVGLGTLLATNGAAAHAFTHILYKALLFMGAGAVLQMAGTSKLTELGGLYRSMPWTFVLYMAGALSISAFPLFSGFTSKTLIVEAAAVDGRGGLYLLMLTASVGTFLSVGLKLPWFTFFGPDRSLSAREAPSNMLLAMTLAALLCLVLGVYPAPLYALLPAGPVDFNAWNLPLVLKELQLLLFTALGFFVLRQHLGGKAKITLDTDWIYRGLPARALRTGADGLARANQALRRMFMSWLSASMTTIERKHGRDGKLARSWPTGSMALWTAIVLASLLVFSLQ